MASPDAAAVDLRFPNFSADFLIGIPKPTRLLFNV